MKLLVLWHQMPGYLSVVLPNLVSLLTITLGEELSQFTTSFFLIHFEVMVGKLFSNG